MTSYLETFRRHRVLLTAPIVLAVVIAMWVVLATPKAYESTTSLWVDNPPPAPSSVGNTDPAVRPPAEQEQLVLQELLHTRDFRLAVADRGPLAGYLAANSTHGWGPTAILFGGGSLDARITSALGPKNVLTTVAGPQVLQVAYTGPTPEVAAATLRALIDEFSRERTRLSAVRGQGTADYWKTQVDAASNAVADAQKALSAYYAAHPGVQGSDSNVKALARAVRDAQTQLEGTTASFNRATSVAGTRSADVGRLEVIDAPRVPIGPTSGHKKIVLALVGGLFAGALISFLGVVALTPGRPDTLPDGPGPAAPSATNGSGPPAAVPAPPASAPPPPVTPSAAIRAADAGGGGQELRGWIVDVHDDGWWKRTRAIWTVRQPLGSTVQIHPGSSVRALDPVGAEGVVRRRKEAEDGGAVFEVEITTPRPDADGEGGPQSMAATDARWLGREIAFVGGTAPGGRGGASA